MTLLSPGPDVPNNLSRIFNSEQDAIKSLQQPGEPAKMAYVALKTSLPAAASYPQCAILCGEINSLVVSTLVAGSYAWRRADGSAL